MGRYRKSMKESLREARLYGVEETTSYPPKEINKKKHDAYKDPKRGEHEPIKREEEDPSVTDISKGLKIDKKTVKKVMGEKLDALISEGPNDQQIRTLKTIMEPMRGGKISADGGLKLIKLMDKFKKKEDLVDLFKADIPFVSALAAGRLIRDHGMSGSQVNKLKEELEEGYTDARTKAYREHRKKLESARQRREERKAKLEKEGKMSQIASYIDDIVHAMKKDRNMKPFIDRFKKDAEKTLDPRKSLEKVLPDYIPGKDIAKILNMSEDFEEARLGYGKDVKINPASLKGSDSIRIQATSGMTTTKQVEREIPLQNKQKKLGLNLRRQQNGFVVKGRKDSIVQLLKGLEDKFMMGIVNPNSLPYTVHKEEVELDEQYKYALVDKNNKVINIFGDKNSANNFKKNNEKIIKKELKPLRIQPMRPNEYKMGDTVLGIGEETLDENQWFDLDENKYTYTVVHAKKGKEIVKANSSYEAAKKFAQMKGLKSTAGVDAHLMEETIKEENIRVLVKDVKDRNFIKDLVLKAKQLSVEVSEKGGRYIFSGEKMKVNEVFNFAFDKSIKRGNYDPATMMHEEVELNERMGPIKPRHYDVEVTIKNARDAEAVDEYISNNMTMGLEDYDNDGIVTASGYTAGTVNFHGDDAGHIGMEIQKKFRGKVKVVGEAVEIAELNLAVESMFQAEDKRNTEKAFDNMIKDGGMDRKDFEKSKQMYKSGDLQGLRKHIYKLDTEPLEAIMQNIMQNDPKAFRTMYPNAKRGDFLSRISYAHGLRKSQNEQYYTGARGLVEKLTGIELTEIDAKALKSLEKKSKASGISLSILKQVFKRGMAAWGSGSRTGMDQTQWSHARVNSFIDKESGTWGGADKDLAKQAKGS